MSLTVPPWIKNYKRADFRPDLIAGLTVGVLLIPQGMAYAMLAGLPPIYGLYASAIPLIIYALLGTSRQLSVGPVAIDSILTAAGVSMIAQAGSQEYIQIAITFALMVGVIQFSFGISRLGVLIKFLSHPVMTGFTSAAAIIIGLNQFEHLLGIDVESNQYLHDIINALFNEADRIHLFSLLLGTGGILLLILFRKFLPTFPAPLLIVVISILVVSVFHLDQYGVSIMGSIPRGLPTPILPLVDPDTFRKLLPTAFAIALVSFMESISIARTLQIKHKTPKVIPDKELMALGLANLVGSIFRSFPVSGGLSRSALNDQAGARTGLSSIFSAALVVLTLLFLTPLFFYLPKAILASIILVAVYQLINLKEAKYLWHVDRKDFLMMMVTFAGTLFLGIGIGIGIGVALSLAWIIYEASYPHHAELGRVPGTSSFRNVRRFKEVEVDDDVLVFRFDAPLFFANIDRFREVMLEYQSKRKTKLKAIIVNMESINTVDSSAINTFSETVDEIRQVGILLLLTEVKGPVRDKFYRSGLTKKIGEENFFFTIEAALTFVSGKDEGFFMGIANQTNDRR